MRPATDARSDLRLLCFAHAGGGAATFRGWDQGLPSTVAVCPVLLPGREYRLREELHTGMASLTDALAEVMAGIEDKPFAFYGHSLGSLVAFELARRLQLQGRPGPRVLFVSGMRAPHLPPSRAPFYQLADDAFLDMIIRYYGGGIPAAVLAEPEMRALALRVLRADFTVLDTYEYRPAPPLQCPITALAGKDDPVAAPEITSPWSQQTTADFRLLPFDGGHFFINTAGTAVLEALREDLSRALSTST